MKLLIIAVITIYVTPILAQEKNEPKIIYQYKKYESFDMGALDLQGDLMAPGDISVRDRDLMKIKIDLFDRKKMKDLMSRDSQSLN